MPDIDEVLLLILDWSNLFLNLDGNLLVFLDWLIVQILNQLAFLEVH
jgi:hypothetical protein